MGFRVGLVLLVAFHAGVALTMNIGFAGNLWAYAVFAPAVWWTATATSLKVPTHLPARAAPVAAILGMSVSIGVVVAGTPLIVLLLDLIGVRRLWFGSGLLLAALALSTVSAYGGVRRRRSTELASSPTG